jgi:hypothetical protein
MRVRPSMSPLIAPAAAAVLIFLSPVSLAISVTARAAGLEETEPPIDRDDLGPIDRDDLGEEPEYEGPAFSPEDVVPRYLVTFVKSRVARVLARGRIQPVAARQPTSATVVSVTNLSDEVCDVSVAWVPGLNPNSGAVCSTDVALEPEVTAGFCSLGVRNDLATFCTAICDPPLSGRRNQGPPMEGRAIVASSCTNIGVSGRVYYVTSRPAALAITDSKVIRLDTGNLGD